MMPSTKTIRHKERVCVRALANYRELPGHILINVSSGRVCPSHATRLALQIRQFHYWNKTGEKAGVCVRACGPRCAPPVSGRDCLCLRCHGQMFFGFRFWLRSSFYVRVCVCVRTPLASVSSPDALISSRLHPHNAN